MIETMKIENPSILNDRTLETITSKFILLFEEAICPLFQYGERYNWKPRDLSESLVENLSVESLLLCFTAILRLINYRRCVTERRGWEK